MKKMIRLTTGLVCAAMLCACSNGAGNDMKKDKMSDKTSMSSSMSKDKMSDKMDKSDKKMSSDKMKKSDNMKQSDKMMNSSDKIDSDMKSSDKMSDDKMTKESDMMSHQAAPDFTLKDLDGKTHRLSDYKGKKVYLKFWASWCSICLSTLSDTKELAQQKDTDFVVLTVVSPTKNGEKSEADFKKWFKGTDFKGLPVLVDNSGKLLEDYGVRSYPTAAFIDSEGNLAKTQVGFMEKEAIEQTLKELK